MYEDAFLEEYYELGVNQDLDFGPDAALLDYEEPDEDEWDD